MNRLTFILIILVLAAGIIRAEEITVESKVKRVTVYTDRAVVEREASVSLQAGETRLIFDFLPESVESSSLQVKGGQGAVLQDIEFKTVYYTTFPDTRINSLQTRLREIGDAMEDKTDAIRRARESKTFLDKIIATVTGTSDEQTVELDPGNWLKMVEFYRTETADLDLQIRSLERENRSLAEEKQKITNEMNHMQQGKSKKKNQAIVILQAGRRTDTNVVLCYLTRGLSWQADYDLRVDSRTKMIHLSYNAVVRQNTGEDWNNINLVLSTARPNISGRHPDLSPWNIYLNNNSNVSLNYRNTSELAPAPQTSNMFDAEMELEKYEESRARDLPISTHEAALAAGATAVRFQVAGTHSLASDNNKHRVTIFTREFPVTFRYSAVPKLSQYAYLKAQVRNVTEFPLLPGTTKVFLDGDFVTSSTMDYITPGEEFWTFLGIDERLQIEYRLVQRKFFRGSVFDTRDGIKYEYEMKITNNKLTTEEIVVWDQLPVSADENIKIKLIEPDYKKENDAFKQNDQGYLEWLFDLKPGREQVIGLTFSIEYPKGKDLRGI